MADLLACPFCGSTNLSTEDARDFIACLDCHAEGPMRSGQGSAESIAAWNRRAPAWKPFNLAEIIALGASQVWLATVSGRVHLGTYAWTQGLRPDRFYSDAGFLFPDEITDYMPFVKPSLPAPIWVAT